MLRQRRLFWRDRWWRWRWRWRRRCVGLFSGELTEHFAGGGEMKTRLVSEVHPVESNKV